MTALASIAVAYVISTATLVVMALRAPEGWQDARGVHFGDRSPVKFHSIHNEAE